MTLGQRLAVVLGLSALLAGVVPAGSAQAQGVSVTGFKGTGVFASFRSTTGCLTHDVFVSAGEHLSISPGNPAGKEANAVVSILSYDTCEGETVFLGSGAASVADFTVAPQLGAAELHATIRVADLTSGTSANVRVDVVWSGTGDLERYHGAGRYEDDAGVVMFHDHASFRDAATSGQVTDGTTAFVPTGTGGAGFLSRTNSGQVSRP